MGQQAQDILSHTIEWTEQLYDWPMEKIEAYLRSKEDSNRILYIEYQYYQIGKTEEWLREMSGSIGDPLVVRREILLQRLHGSSSFPYPLEDLEYISGCEQKPIDEIWLLDFYKFDVYERLQKNIPYIVGIDCSTGTNSDNNAITVLNPYTCKPVAEFQCSFIGETKYEELIIELVTKYIPRACVCIERNSVGDGIIDHLLHSRIASRLYYDKAKDLVAEKSRQNEEIESMLKKQAGLKSFYGVYTTGKSRDDMFAILARNVAEYKGKFVTKNIIKDLSGLVKTRSGKIEAGPGNHDDNIMSYLIALYVYYHGNNLPAFGIILGEQANDPKNQGMKRPEEINPQLVDPQLIAEVQHQQDLEDQPDWDSMLRETLMREQERTKVLANKGMIHSGFASNDSVYRGEDEYYDDSGYVDLSIFDSLNNF